MQEKLSTQYNEAVQQIKTAILRSQAKAAGKREQCQAKEQREQSEACFDFAESRLSSRNSNCLSILASLR